MELTMMDVWSKSLALDNFSELSFTMISTFPCSIIPYKPFQDPLGKFPDQRPSSESQKTVVKFIDDCKWFQTSPRNPSIDTADEVGILPGNCKVSESCTSLPYTNGGFYILQESIMNIPFQTICRFESHRLGSCFDNNSCKVWSSIQLIIFFSNESNFHIPIVPWS